MILVGYRNKKFVALLPCLPIRLRHKDGAAIRVKRTRRFWSSKEERKLTVVDFKQGEVVAWKGVVSVIKETLEWVILKRTKKGWE